jgi:aminomethyltransferase
MRSNAKGCAPVDVSDDYAQMALQGPKAAEILQPLTQTPLASLANYRFTTGQVFGIDCIISRTGYTGEDGFELYCAPGDAERLWNQLIESGRPHGLSPAGLGCRDSLRTEMKYALYGNDIDDAHTPLEAGLGWIVKLDKKGFIGQDVLVKQKAAGVTRKLVGFEMTESGIPRAHYPILKDGQRVGEVTSGTMGPSVKKAIGIGYVPTALAAEGTTLEIEIRGRPVAARVVKTPFLKKGK